MPDAEAGLVLCDERATPTTLLQSERTAGHAATRRLHAHRRSGDRGRTPERPTAAADRSRRDESPRARAADGGPIVDLDARGEATIGEPGGGALDAQLACPNDEFGPVDAHGIRPGGRRRRSR